MQQHPSRNLLGDESTTQSGEIFFSLAPTGGGGGPASRSDGQQQANVPAAVGNDALALDERARRLAQQDQQILVSPPGTLKSLHTAELRSWAVEVVAARGIPMQPAQGPNGPASTQSWVRKQRNTDPPTWVLPFSPAMTRTFRALKKPAGLLGVLKQPYARDLVVRCDEHGPCELATLNPSTGQETNTWPISVILDVLTLGSSVFLALPGSFWKAPSHLEITMESEEAAAALATDWGYFLADDALLAGSSPPVLTTGGEAFTFRH